MKKSNIKLDSRYKFNSERWIVSLITTKETLGYHSRIVIEGIYDDPQWINSKGNVLKDTVFIAEYHVVPEKLGKYLAINSGTQRISYHSKMAVSYTESTIYSSQSLDECKRGIVKGWRISKERAMRMIAAIKEEQNGAGTNNFDCRQPKARYLHIDNKYEQTSEMWCNDVLAVANIKNEKLPYFWWLAPNASIIPSPHQQNSDTTTQPPKIIHHQNTSCSSFWYQKPEIVLPVVAGATILTVTGLILGSS